MDSPVSQLSPSTWTVWRVCGLSPEPFYVGGQGQGAGGGFSNRAGRTVGKPRPSLILKPPSPVCTDGPLVL